MELIDLGGNMGVDGKGAEIENPDDAAAQTRATGVAVTWPLVCHAQMGSPFKGPLLIPSALSCKIFEQSFTITVQYLILHCPNPSG